MTRTNEVDQSFSPNMSYKPKFSHNQASDISYSPTIDNKPTADNNIEVTNNVKNGEGKRYKAEVVRNYYQPKVVDTPQAKGAKNTNGVNQDFGADMSYNPNSKETQTKREGNAKKGLVDQSFSPIMSYKPKVLLRNYKEKAPRGSNMSYCEIIKKKPRADQNTKKTEWGFRDDISYKPEGSSTPQPVSPNMSYKPYVSSTPRAINTNGVNQAFGADMSYSPDIAKNTKLAGADMSYSPRIKNKPYFHDK